MKSNRMFWTVLVVAGIFGICRLEEAGGESARIAGAGGKSSFAESIVEGSLEKYDSVLNKLIVRGIDDDKMTLDAVRSLKAKDRDKRIPMGMVKQGQKIRVFYIEKGDKKIAKDVEVVHDAPEVNKSSTEMPGAKDDDTPADIPEAR